MECSHRPPISGETHSAWMLSFPLFSDTFLGDGRVGGEGQEEVPLQLPWRLFKSDLQQRSPVCGTFPFALRGLLIPSIKYLVWTQKLLVRDISFQGFFASSFAVGNFPSFCASLSLSLWWRQPLTPVLHQNQAVVYSGNLSVHCPCCVGMLAKWGDSPSILRVSELRHFVCSFISLKSRKCQNTRMQM